MEMAFEIELTEAAPASSDVLTATAWRDDRFDFWAFDRRLDVLVARGAPLRDRSLAVLPGGESGIPASPHYADLMGLWLDGRYHPLLMDREEIDDAVEGRLVLNPG